MTETPFSERYGFSPAPVEITVRQEASYDLRGIVPDLAYECGLRAEEVRDIVCRITFSPSDWSAQSFDDFNAEVRQILRDCEWFAVYDVIESLCSVLRRRSIHLTETGHDLFESRLNAFFLQNGIGWQLIDGRIEVRGEEVFESVTRPAIAELEAAGLETTAGEIHEALKDLSRRPEPDITGAIQHAMAAAECIARKASNDTGTLGKIITAHPELFPRPMDKGLDKLWGYASEMGRHIREGRDPSFEEAELAVTVAAAAVTYLRRKLEGAEVIDG